MCTLLREYKELLKGLPLKLVSLKDLKIKEKIKEKGKIDEEEIKKLSTKEAKKDMALGRLQQIIFCLKSSVVTIF